MTSRATLPTVFFDLCQFSYPLFQFIIYFYWEWPSFVFQQIWKVFYFVSYVVLIVATVMKLFDNFSIWALRSQPFPAMISLLVTGVDLAKELCHSHALKAVKDIESLEDGDAKAALHKIISFLANWFWIWGTYWIHLWLLLIEYSLQCLNHICWHICYYF